MIYGNLPPVTNNNSTTNYFDNFFVNGQSASENVNDAVIGYFQTLTGDVQSGTTLAASVLYIALSRGIDPMVLVDQFRKMKSGELTAYLTMLLNSNRVGTSLLGLSNSPQTSPYITRAILA